MDGQMWNGDPELGTTHFSPTVQNYADLGLDRPMVVGELIISDQAQSRLDNLLANGYAGAWPWSLTSRRCCRAALRDRTRSKESALASFRRYGIRGW